MGVVLPNRGGTMPYEGDTLYYLNPQYLNPRLSKLQSQAKVQVKVQISGMTSKYACTVECSAAIVCYVCVNDS